MSYFEKMGFSNTKSTKTPRSRQSKLPKTPKDYNGSKPIPGPHEVTFKNAKMIDNG